MTTLHTLLVTTHIAAGALALVLFWIPAIARKGGRVHVRSGQAYLLAMYAVSITALLASLLVLADPLGVRRAGGIVEPDAAARLSTTYRVNSLFLLMLAVLVMSNLRHGVLALRARRAPDALRSVGHRCNIALLGLLAVGVGTIGILYTQVLLMVFAGISIASALGMWRESRIVNPTTRELVMAHLSGLIGSGIGAYTAFFAFGGSRLLADLLVGQWMILAWIAPSIIGTIAISRLKRPFRLSQRAAGSGTAQAAS